MSTIEAITDGEADAVCGGRAVVIETNKTRYPQQMPADFPVQSSQNYAQVAAKPTSATTAALAYRRY